MLPFGVSIFLSVPKFTDVGERLDVLLWGVNKLLYACACCLLLKFNCHFGTEGKIETPNGSMTFGSCKSSLCKPSNTSMAENHIKAVHSNNDNVVTYFINKANKRRSTSVFDSAGTSGIFQNTLKLARVETTRRLISSCWIYC